MSKFKAKFVHWSGDNYELHAMFDLPNGSTVNINEVDRQDLNHEPPPDYLDWKTQTDAGIRCRHCWGRHSKADHMEKLKEKLKP